MKKGVFTIKKWHVHLSVITIVLFAGGFLAYSMVPLKPAPNPTLAPVSTLTPEIQSAQGCHIDPPGVDLSDLTEAQRTLALEIMEEEGCPCGCGQTIADCRNNDMDCLVSPSLEVQVVSLVKQNKSEADIKSALSVPPEVQRYTVSTGDDPVRGPADAPVTLVEFGDFACGFTARGYVTVEKLMVDYDGKLRFIYKDFQTMGGWSPKAMTASECAYEQGNDEFWYFYNKLFQGRNSNSISGANIDSKVIEWASEANLNADAFKNCYDSQESLPAIQRDIQEGGKLGITITPTFYINGRKLVGAQPYHVFKSIIDAELEKGGSNGH